MLRNRCEAAGQGCCGWVSAFSFEAVFTDPQLPYLEGGSPQRRVKLAKKYRAPLINATGCEVDGVAARNGAGKRRRGTDSEVQTTKDEGPCESLESFNSNRPVEDCILCAEGPEGSKGLA